MPEVAARPVIGIPRSLLYHRYGVLWTEFFSALGCRVVVSPPTDRAILSRGLHLAVDESCLPAKIHLGHVDVLKDRADYVLVPRISSIRRHEENCVKLKALYDVTAQTLTEVPLLEYTVDWREGRAERAELLRLGRRFEPRTPKVLWAYERARFLQRLHDAREGRRADRALREPDRRPKVLVVGHSYNTADEFIGRPVTRHLDALGVRVLDAEDFGRRRTRRLGARSSPHLYWTYNKELLGAVERCRGLVDGVVFLVTFPCGPDSLVAELCQRRLKGTPFLPLVLDEHQAEAGLRTRLESFVDVIEARRAGPAAAGGAT